MPRRLLLLSSILLGLPAMAMAQSATNWVPEQNRGAAEADAAGINDVIGLLNAALTAIRANRRSQAVEFMERAEVRLLTSSTPVLQAGSPVQGGIVGRIGNARRAALAENNVLARKEIAAALAALNRPRPAAR